MAGVTGTDVHYEREGKLGLTTLTFRKRRYVFPNVVVKDDEVVPHSASTGDLQSSGMCVMLDVGLFCPHCAGAISAKLSGSHSKLIISKADAIGHHCLGTIEAGNEIPQLEYSEMTDSGVSSMATESHTVSKIEATGLLPTAKQAKIKKIKTESESEESNIMFDSLEDQTTPVTRNQHEKLSSSDYESLDRDSQMNSLNSNANSTATCVSMTCRGSIPSSHVDDAYCSLPSSRSSNTPDAIGHMSRHELPKMPRLNSKYSSLPRDVYLPTNGYSSDEERLILDSMHVDVSDANDSEVLVDELLSDEIIDEEYQNLMNASKSSIGSSVMSHLPDNNKLTDEVVFDVSRDEDSASDRSASPEIAVDDILENLESEIFSGDATLRRVFAIRKDGSIKRCSAKQKRKGRIHGEIRHEGDKQLKCVRQSGEREGNTSMPRDKLRELVKSKYKNIQRTINTQQKTDFIHEKFFDDVMEALTDLEGGFNTDWTSDYDSDHKDAMMSTTDSDGASISLGYHLDEQYGEALGVYNIARKTATSSCECIPDDRSRYMDSSLEHITSTIESQSDASGEFSMEGYDSSSECSYSEKSEPLKDGTVIFEQLIQGTQTLTDDLKVVNDSVINATNGNLILCDGNDGNLSLVRPDRRPSPMREQCDVIDEIVIQDGHHELHSGSMESTMLEYQYAHAKYDRKVPVDIVRTVGPVPTVIEPAEEHDINFTSTPLKRRSRSEGESSCDDVDSSLENLLTANRIHCSTSDLDEPFVAELQRSQNADDICDTNNEEIISQDFQKCLQTKTTEIDEYVPEINDEKPSTEVLKQAYETAQYCASILETQHVVDSHSISTKKTQNDTNSENLITDYKEPQMKITTLERKAKLSKKDAQDFMKYVLSKTCETHHSAEHHALDTCVDQKCQTCNFQPEGPKEVVKNEEVTTQEMTLVFAWPKKLGQIPRELAPVVPKKPGQPFRTIHLRRVMRVSDVDMEVIEGPTIKTIEYNKEGKAKKSTVKGETVNSITYNDATNDNLHANIDTNKVDQDLQKGRTPELETSINSDMVSGDRDLNDTAQTPRVESSPDKPGYSSLADEELSHYMTTSESFVMPCLDSCVTQRSEELFDKSSAASFELLGESELKVEGLYGDHQKALEKLFEQEEQYTHHDVPDSEPNYRIRAENEEEGADGEASSNDIHQCTSDQADELLVHNENTQHEENRLVLDSEMGRIKMNFINRSFSNPELNMRKLKHRRHRIYNAIKSVSDLINSNVNGDKLELDLKTNSLMDNFLFAKEATLNMTYNGVRTDRQNYKSNVTTPCPVHSQHAAAECQSVSNATTQTSFDYGDELIEEYFVNPLHMQNRPSNMRQSINTTVDPYLFGSVPEKLYRKRPTLPFPCVPHEKADWVGTDPFWDKYLFGNENKKTTDINQNIFRKLKVPKQHFGKHEKCSQITESPKRGGVGKKDLLWKNLTVPQSCANTLHCFSCRGSDQGVPGKDQNLMFIPQNTRNILLVNAGKYFSQGLQPDDVCSTQSYYSESSGEVETIQSEDRVCPRCSDFYVFDEHMNLRKKKKVPTATLR